MAIIFVSVLLFHNTCTLLQIFGFFVICAGVTLNSQYGSETNREHRKADVENALSAIAGTAEDEEDHDNLAPHLSKIIGRDASSKIPAKAKGLYL